MKLSPDFEKFLSFIPEILSRDESFLRDLESCTRGVTIRKGDYLIRTGLSLGYPAFATCYQNVMLMIISKLYSMFAVRQTCKAEEFLKYLYTNHQWIVSRVPDKYIAQYMGVSDSWYCKLKKRILY